jgi:alcohol dehydrogenase
VTDTFLYEHKIADRVGDQLLAAGAEYAIYYLVQPNPTVQVINDCLTAARELQVDFLVAVGGGSAIDTAKAVSIVLANGGKVEDYEGADKSARPGLPIVAVNTTAGTGSEVTSFYVVTNPVTHSKMVMMDKNCMVSIAINDVDFMMTMPPSLTSSTGMDAMTHAIEAIISKRATPFTNKDAMWAIRTIKDYLPKAVADGKDVKAREMMAYAEYTAGLAFSNAGLGMVHAMAHSLGGHFNLPHGLCNSVLLPYGMKFNGKLRETSGRFQLIAEALELPDAGKMSDSRAAAECVDYIKNMSKGMGMTSTLKELKGVTPERFGDLADLALKDFCMVDNPIQPSRAQVIEVYREAYEGRL